MATNPEERSLLAHCLGKSLKTIYRWGHPPDFNNIPESERPSVEKMLALIDALKQSEEVLKKYGLHQEYLDRLD